MKLKALALSMVVFCAAPVMADSEWPPVDSREEQDWRTLRTQYGGRVYEWTTGYYSWWLDRYVAERVRYSKAIDERDLSWSLSIGPDGVRKADNWSRGARSSAPDSARSASVVVRPMPAMPSLPPVPAVAPISAVPLDSSASAAPPRLPFLPALPSLSPSSAGERLPPLPSVPALR
jgi:hypothetical protein